MRPLLRLTGDDVPTVDVLITYCGEGLDVVLDTVRAACALDYPTNRYRVILSDDGNSVDLQNRIDIMRKHHGNLFYTTRGVDVAVHSKAANLNHALAFVEGLKASEYVAFLDVDMIPMPTFLRALVPHLLNDLSLAMATSPQCFYNIPDSDPLCQCLSSSFDIQRLLEDSSGLVFCTGTGFVLRSSAAKQIGGIPTDHVMEDIMTSLLLLAKGWKIAYVWEPLQWGLVPNNFAGRAMQATKMAKGFTALIPAVMDSPLADLSFSERLRTALSSVAFVGPTLALTCAMLFIPTVLIFEKPFVTPKSPQQLRNLLTLSALQLLVTWLNGLITAEATSFQLPIWPSYRLPFLAPFLSIAISRLLFPFRQYFSPSGSTDNEEREREALASKSLMKHLNFLFRDLSLWLHLLVITSMIVSATLNLKAVFSQNVDSHLRQLFVGAAWPPAFVHWIMFIVQCWKPVAYVIFPLRRYPREALLDRDPKTKLAYPSAMAKDGQRIRPSQGFPLVILTYSVFVLGCSWGFRFE
ncbi:MAG: hypothetical protein Q9161_006601 [Pseudevernia consocians]